MRRKGAIALAGAATPLSLPVTGRAEETTKLALGYGLTSGYLPASIAKENDMLKSGQLDADLRRSAACGEHGGFRILG